MGEDYLDSSNLSEARFHLELFIALAQDQGERAWAYLVRAHGRLVDVAEAGHEDYDEELNRGIGLFWLATMHEVEPNPDEGLSPASLHCRAVAELKAARELQSDQARVHFYLGMALENLGQHRQAMNSFQLADRLSLLSRLTPWERRTLGRMLLEGNVNSPRLSSCKRLP